MVYHVVYMVFALLVKLVNVGALIWCILHWLAYFLVHFQVWIVWETLCIPKKYRRALLFTILAH